LHTTQVNRIFHFVELNSRLLWHAFTGMTARYYWSKYFMTLSQSNVSITIPEMTMEQYARFVGVTTGTVEKWVERGYLPSFKLGKYRMVNVMQRMTDCANQITH
jgi:excisionase family DNA binding protein